MQIKPPFSWQRRRLWIFVWDCGDATIVVVVDSSHSKNDEQFSLTQFKKHTHFAAFGSGNNTIDFNTEEKSQDEL